MPNMILGSYTFATNPSSIPQMIQNNKAVASRDTIDSVAVFEWPATIKGVKVKLHWDYLSTDQYDSLFTIYATGGTVTFDPQDGSTRTFDVSVLSCTGEYFVMIEDAAGNNRQNVDLTLVITDEQ